MIHGGSQLTLTGTGQGVISGTSSSRAAPAWFAKNGPGTWTLSGSNTFTGSRPSTPARWSSPTPAARPWERPLRDHQRHAAVRHGRDRRRLSSSSSIADNGVLVFNRSNAVVQGTDFSAVPSRAAARWCRRSRNLILTAANGYTGGTTISGGTLQFGNGNSGSDGSVPASGGIVNNAALSLRPLRRPDLRRRHQRVRLGGADRQQQPDPQRREQLHRPHNDQRRHALPR